MVERSLFRAGPFRCYLVNPKQIKRNIAPEMVQSLGPRTGLGLRDYLSSVGVRPTLTLLQVQSVPNAHGIQMPERRPMMPNTTTIIRKVLEGRIEYNDGHFAVIQTYGIDGVEKNILLQTIQTH
jgi:hypothetical protein